MKHKIKAVWDYRYFILSSIKNEFRARFIRSKFGALWMILHPLAQVLIYALVLSEVLKTKLPGIESHYSYAIYLMAGMVGWSLFADIVGRSLNVFIDNGNLLKKLAFPKITLVLIVIGSAFVNFMLLLLAMFVVFGALGHVAIAQLLWLPLLIAITLLMATGIGLLLGVINVFMRDIGQVMGIVLQFWFWLTPVVYTITVLPQGYRDLFKYNPMTGVVLGYHNVLVYDQAPDLTLLGYPALFGLVAVTMAYIVFKRANEEMVDVL